MAKEAKQVEKEDKGTTMGKREANKRAALIGFGILYNGGEKWPDELYQDDNGDPLSDADKMKMHQGYLVMLEKLAKLGGKTPKRQVSVTFE